MNATAVTAEQPAAAKTFSFLELVVGFIEYAAKKKGVKSFAGVFDRLDLWGNFLYQTYKELGEKFPGPLSSLSRPDWDAHYPTYPDMQGVIYSLSSYGACFEGRFRWLMEYPVGLIPPELASQQTLFEAMFKIAVRHNGLLELKK